MIETETLLLLYLYTFCNIIDQLLKCIWGNTIAICTILILLFPETTKCVLVKSCKSMIAYDVKNLCIYFHFEYTNTGNNEYVYC